jgi:hypothetical protein
MFRVSFKDITLYSLVGICLLVILNLVWMNNILVTSITTVVGSIFASIIISIIFQNILHDSFQTYSKIGIRKTYKNFEEAFESIKKDISKSSKVDIFFMYGSSFINNASISIKDALSKKNTKLRFFIFSPDNPYIQAYGNQWSTDSLKYNSDGIKNLILDSKENIKKIYDSIDKEIRGSLEIYEIINSPLSYSFYKIDSKLYYVPSKLTTSKLFKHPVFLFEKSKDDRNLYNSIEKELDIMINSNEIIKIYPI